jgi:hypothetical protein
MHEVLSFSAKVDIIYVNFPRFLGLKGFILFYYQLRHGSL